KRHGTHAVKNRVEVRGGGAKPWRQKGTGRARQGSTRSPQWDGGGTVFGPTTSRNYKYKLPKKVRKSALKSALASKVKQDEIIVLDDLQLDAPKTKEGVQVLDELNVNENVLIVTADKNDNVNYSTNKAPTVKTVSVNEINVLDLVAYDKLVITKDAAEKAGEVLA